MKKVIGIWGDSITYGAGDTEKGGWVARLRFFLDKKGENFRINNRGICGDKTEDLLKRFNGESKAIGPKIIIFAIGTNDSQYVRSRDNQRVPIKKFEKNLRELVKSAKKFTNNIIFLGLVICDDSKTMPIPWKQTKYYENAIIKEYDSKINEICRENKLLFVPMFDLLSKKDLCDGLHPNPKGYEKMFQRVKTFLIKTKIV